MLAVKQIIEPGPHVDAPDPVLTDQHGSVDEHLMTRLIQPGMEPIRQGLV